MHWHTHTQTHTKEEEETNKLNQFISLIVKEWVAIKNAAPVTPSTTNRKRNSFSYVMKSHFVQSIFFIKLAASVN